MDQDKLAARIAALSPARRAVLEQGLRQAGLSAASLRSIARRESRDAAPLSFAQQRMWFLNQLEPKSCSYNEPNAIRLRGALDMDALRAAFDQLLARHEVLRSTIVIVDGEPRQVVNQNVTLDFPLIDLRATAPALQHAELQQRLIETIRVPFDLSRDLPLRVLLVRVGHEEHILLTVIHHIASDGWSSGIVWHELGRYYRDHLSGVPSDLPPLAIQYRDYAQWQRDWLQGEVLQAQVSYWRKQLDGVAPLGLPLDRARNAGHNSASARTSLELDAGLTESLIALSKKQGVTVFMTLLAAFQTLLHRYCGQEDIVVGTPIAGRTQLEFESVVGLFVNTLALRVSAAGDPTFQELLAQVREVALGAYAHQDVPFEKLVEELNPVRDLDTTPLFQVFFAYQNTPRETVDFPGLTFEPMEVSNGEAKFDFFLAVLERDAGFILRADYATDLFDANTIERLLESFQRLLRGVAQNPVCRLSELPLLTEAERRRLVIQWNDTRRGYPRYQCVHQLFQEQVERTPEAVAVCADGQELTYKELNGRANRLARRLGQLGVTGHTHVAICLERGLDMTVAVLGVLKAGAAYVPLDPDYPRERLEFILHDAQAAVVLTQRRWFDGGRWRMEDSDPQSSFRYCLAQVIYLDEEGSPANTHSEENLHCSASSDQPAYIIYTSGSTGAPKGVVMEHRSLVNLISWQVAHSFASAQARTLQFASLSFDVSFQEMFSTWCSGGALVLLPGEIRRDPAALLSYLRAQRVERIFLPFVALQQLAEAAQMENLLVPELREIITAGEQLQITPQIRRLFEMLPDCRLVNQYGPTESHVVTVFTLAESIHDWPALPPIGRPIQNAMIFVLDARLQPVPVGVAGEIYIAGEGVARGYFNRPELTAERFITHSFDGEPAQRLYKTGDLGRYLSDGNIEYLGRSDDQVKIRGYRIELGEIEAALRQHPAVRECVVIAYQEPITDSENPKSKSDPFDKLRAGSEHRRKIHNPKLDKRLVAYIMSHHSQQRINELREFLKLKLPDYMIPSGFVFLESLPLTPNGKIDRRALRAPDQSRPSLVEGYRAPHNPTEEMLAEIWGEVLRVERIGIDDNFFALGGHSLLATQVTSRMSRTLQVEIPLRTLFEAPTVAGLAQVVREIRRTDYALQTPPLFAVSRDEDLPLSFTQQRLWFLNQLEPGNSVYNVPSALRIRGPLDVTALELSLVEIVRRHEILRTSFSTLDGEPVQIVVSSVSVSLPVVDLSEPAESECEKEARRLAREDARRPFELAGGPLVRATLLRLGREDHVLLLNLHHIACDGWSLGVLYRELSVLYEAFSNEQPSPLMDLPVQYADFALWQRRWLAGEVLQTQLSYWRDQLARVSALQLPTDRSRPALQSYRGARQSIELSKELTQGLKALSRSHDVTLYMTLLAAFQTLLCRYTGQEDISVGSPIANRTRQEIEGLIGNFVNTLVMRSDLSGNPTFRELLARVREVALGAYAHQDLPFEKLVEELQPARNLSYSPLFQVLFVLQNAPTSAWECEGLTVRSFAVQSETAKFDLTLSMQEEADGLKGSLEYSTDLFDDTTIERLLGHFKILLNGVVEDPERRISQLPMLSADERHRLLVQWNDRSEEYPKNKCIHQLFEEQVESSPDAVALVYEDRQLTYGELNIRANQLAHYLKKLGVAREALVGICMERSIEMIVGLLGILKSGAAYLPIDPELPRERIEFMLDESQASLLLTQAPLHKLNLSFAGTRIALDRDWDEIARESMMNLGLRNNSNTLAYVIYTSGSTGKPKGVMIEHRSVVNLFTAMAREPGLTAKDVLLAVTPLSFDIAALEIYLPLTVGARVVLVRREVAVDGESLAKSISSCGVTVLQATPATWRALLASGWEGARKLKALCGGETLSNTLAEDLIDRCGSLWNMYGPTETTIWSSFESVASHLGRVTLGRPIANTQFYILDPHSNPVPTGVVGEIYIGGDGVARGYLNQLELTAEKFIRHSFAGEPPRRLYKTGDLGRYLNDGKIEFLGRIDNQVKIRGYRIELGEIESVLAQHPAVREAVVIVKEDATGDKRLVAYMVPRSEAPAIVELRDYLKSKLPEHMIPSAFMVLPVMPLTPNGKVDRAALRNTDLDPAELAQTHVGPRHALEQSIAAIWSEVLGIEQIGVHANFFHIGGHSLKAIQVVSRLRRKFHPDIPLRHMFEYPTIAELTVAINLLLGNATNGRKVDYVLSEIEALSDEEAQKSSH